VLVLELGETRIAAIDATISSRIVSCFTERTRPV
jgi:hypothetical protein